MKLLSGLKWAAYLLAIQVVLAGGSYLTACAVYESLECSVHTGGWWIFNHPVFSTFIWLFPLLGLVFGAFAPALPDRMKALLSRHQGLLAWIFVAMLAAAFLLWGLPELYYLLRY